LLALGSGQTSISTLPTKRPLALTDKLKNKRRANFAEELELDPSASELEEQARAALLKAAPKPKGKSKVAKASTVNDSSPGPTVGAKEMLKQLFDFKDLVREQVGEAQTMIPPLHADQKPTPSDPYN
jgi:hypothetical protein